MRLSSPLPVFLVASFSFSWLVWLPLAINVWWPVPVLPGQFFIASFGPLFGAVCAEYGQGGFRQVKSWLARTFSIGSGWRFWGRIVLMLTGYALAAVVTAYATEGTSFSLRHWGETNKLPGWNALFVAFAWMLTFGWGEESGWRGWLFPHLTGTCHPLKAALWVAVVWMAWHLPAFVFNDNYRQMGWGVIGWGISLFYGSALLGWLWLRGRSVLPLILWHGGFDLLTASDYVPAQVPMVISAIVIAQGILASRQLAKADRQATGLRS